ncbi:ATP-binding protein [Pseudomarimonas arenosa]|uniref:histidine kinase n=1 Tax=Pseudomarimonas arenosa TaxID=2774145 RepID=A0AAW3ZV02_9GAMM|nr:ATP-binding protein [Pseudomarimonas arenosa]MBD8527876.1 ATP-binding protein [Pseudomarimonas arenosa]
MSLPSSLNRWLPRRLTTQLVLVAVLTLTLAQIVVFPLFVYVRLSSVAATIQDSAISRFASTAKLMMSTPQSLHSTILDSIGKHPVEMLLLPADAVQPPAPDLPLADELRAQLLERAGPALRDARVYATAVPPPNKPVISIHAELPNGQQLWAQLRLPDHLPTWSAVAMLTAGVLSTLLAISMVLILRRLTRPLARLAAAAESLGRGKQGAALTEEGPQDIVDTIRAFNLMQVRIGEHIEARTRMLASVSHDLRTPLTALRLQAEFVSDCEQRDRMLKTLDEMDAVTSSALAYLTNSRSTEASRAVEMSALVDSVCEELRLIGYEVDCAENARILGHCRPSLMKRAISNLVRNAAQYGHRAQVSLSADPQTITITIDDDGRGIPESEYEQVIKPYHRLESSRSRQTGGSGLGLAIAHDIILGHRGTLQFSHRSGGGFRQRVVLPRQS